jgi:hypothetical protein
VIEHVLGCLTQINDPLCHRWRFDPISHILGINRTGGVIIAADPTDPARYEMGVPRIFIFHKDTVTPENGGSAVALDHFLVGEVNFRKDAQTSNYPSDRIPGHFYDIFRVGSGLFYRGGCGRHCDLL